MEITTQQIKAIATVCTRLGMDSDQKANLIHSFTDGRSTSTKELNNAEARALLMKLNDMVPVDERVIKMRNKIFYYAHEMGWTKVSTKTGRIVADGARVDRWMLEYSYLKKKLNNYTYKELPKLVSQFEAVYKHFLSTF